MAAKMRSPKQRKIEEAVGHLFFVAALRSAQDSESRNQSVKAVLKLCGADASDEAVNRVFMASGKEALDVLGDDLPEAQLLSSAIARAEGSD